MAKVRPETSTPWMVPLSICQPKAESHVPPSGSAPTQQVIITHIFLGSLVERNYRAELVHKRYHAKCLVTSVHRNAPKDMGNDDTMRTKGSLWSGVGTLAVALGGWLFHLQDASLDLPPYSLVY